MTEASEKRQDFTRINPIQWDSSWPESAKNHEREFLFSYLKDRFGIRTEIFDDYLILKKKKSWWILRESDFVSKAARLKSQVTGLKAFQEINEFIKPTTRFIQIFGHKATKAVCNINEDDLRWLLSGECIGVDMGINNGYVILRCGGCIIGLSLLINGQIRSQIPKKDLINYV